jgi:hypothetical protein
MFENIDKIRQNRETNSSSVKEQKRIIQDEIQELRTKVNNHLDKLQENLMKELIRSLLYFQEQLPPYSLYDFPRYKFHNTDTHGLYSIN